MSNILLSTDSYKLSHYKQYPPGTEYIYSYIEPRKGAGLIVIKGINRFVQLIQNAVTRANVEELEDIARLHGVPFNIAWYAVLKKHKGILPIRVQGVPEGTLVTAGTPVCTIVNTDPEFPWLTSFLETLFLRCVWYPSSVASVSREIKVIIKKYMEMTGADMGTLPFKLHDFGSRGATCGTAAAIGGAGHLINFLGTDNIEAIKYVRDNHNEAMAGFSIPATEHSTVTSWGRDGEKEMYREFIRRNLGDGKIAACVSDSYNIWEALRMWQELKPYLLETGGTLVIRPDSGNPVSTPVKVIMECLGLFGYTRNDKGYCVLPNHIRVIQGDGINKESLEQICIELEARKISIDNIAFGMGGGLLNDVVRDTYGWAMKCSAARVNGEWRDVWKDPVGGGKTSKKGLVHCDGVSLYEDAERIILEGEWLEDFDGIQRVWVDYYHNGKTRKADDWSVIRKRAEVN